MLEKFMSQRNGPRGAATCNAFFAFLTKQKYKNIENLDYCFK
jgi:hypothetical protein